jgi:hypothetical protein
LEQSIIKKIKLILNFGTYDTHIINKLIPGLQQPWQASGLWGGM